MSDHPAAPALRAFLAEPGRDQALRRFAARRALFLLGEPQEGEDIYGESLHRALNLWDQVAERGQEPDADGRAAWCRAIIEYVARERARKRRRQPSPTDIGELDDGQVARSRSPGRQIRSLPDPTGERVVQREAVRDLLPPALGRLPRSARSVMERHLDGASEGEIAAELGIAASSVRASLHRARAFLSEQLDPRDPDSAASRSRPRG